MSPNPEDVNPPEPDEDLLMAQAFIAALTGDAATPIRLRFLDDDRSPGHQKAPSAEIEGPIDQLWEQVCDYQARGYGVFYFLNVIAPGLEGFATDHDVTGIRALAVDDDMGTITEWHVQPRLVVNTSRVGDTQKKQALWPVDGLAVDDFKLAQQRLATSYHSDQNISNPSRVLRLPGTYHQKDHKNPQRVTFEEFSVADGLPYSAAEVLDGLPEIVAPEPSKPTGKRVSWEGLRERLAFVHPQFDGKRPVCYSQPDARHLSYDGQAWLGIALCLRDGNIPWLGREPSPQERMTLVEQWSNGALWRERTGEQIEVTTFPKEGIPARLGGRERNNGAITTVATINAYASDGGCLLPSADEPQPSAAETFAHIAYKQIALAPELPVEAAKPLGVVLERMSDVTPQVIKWLWKDHIPAGMLTAIGGDPDCGKSTLVNSIIAAVTTGGAMPLGAPAMEAGSVIVLNAEDVKGRVLAPRLMAAGADLSRVIRVKPMVRDEQGERVFDLSADLDAIKKAITDLAAKGETVRLITIDPLNAYYGSHIDGNNSADLRRLLTPLAEWADEHQITVLVVMHLNKSSASRNPLNRLNGSHAVGAAARSTILIAPERDNDGNETGRFLFMRGKLNLSPRGIPNLAYRLEGVDVTVSDGVVSHPTVKWEGAVAISADEAFSDDYSKPRTKQDDAALFLAATLADGPVAVTKLKEMASGRGLAWRTIERAKAKLGVGSRQTGGRFGGAAQFHEWYLRDIRQEHADEEKEAAALLDVIERDPDGLDDPIEVTGIDQAANATHH